MKTSFTIVILLTMVSLIVNCTNGPVSGSGSQTTNSITLAVRADSITVTGERDMTVQIYAAGYVPVDESGYADTGMLSGGSCLFSALPPDTYTVLVTDPVEKVSAIVQHIQVTGNGNDIYTDSLEPVGSLGGAIQLNGQPLIAGIVYVKGTPFSTVSNETGTYRLSPLPFGSYRLSVRPNRESPNDDFELQEIIDISSYSPENTWDIAINP
jgi:hypothetical protein